MATTGNMGNKNAKESAQSRAPVISSTQYSVTRHSSLHPANNQHTKPPEPYRETFLPSAPCEDVAVDLHHHETTILYPNLRRESLATQHNRDISNTRFPGLYPNLPDNSKSNFMQHSHTQTQHAERNLKKEVSVDEKKKTEQTSKSPDYKWIFILSQMESAHIVSVIKDQRTRFITVIKTFSDPDMVYFILRILRKANSLGYQEMLLNDVCCDNFLAQLNLAVGDLSRDKTSKDDLQSFFGDVLSFYKMFLPMLRGTFNEHFKVLLAKTTLAIHYVEYCSSNEILDEIKQSLKHLETACDQSDDCKEKKINRVKKKQQCYKVRPEVANLLRSMSRNVDQFEISEYANVRGVTRNVFFVDTNKQRKENDSNEAFLIHLAKYLLKQNYQAKEITILVTSECKLPIITKLKEADKSMKDIEVQTTSNSDRVERCITLVYFTFDPSTGEKMNLNMHILSVLLRAKEGLYMIGDTSLLQYACDEWKMVRSAFTKENALGPHLTLYCHRHCERIIQVGIVEEFPQHFCREICNALLPCGHTCRKVCHVKDPDHLLYQCRAPCTRKLENCNQNHDCSKRCYEDCDPCVVKIYADNNEWKECHEFKQGNKRCSVSLKCGHNCGLLLEIHNSVNDHNENCTKCPGYKKNYHKNVSEKHCEAVLPCEHKKYVTFKMAEFLVPKLDLKSKELIDLCEKPCLTPLTCGHECSGTCGQCRQGNVHVVCPKRTRLLLACGHRVNTPCSSTINECRSGCFYICPHGKCRNTCGQPCSPCKMKCELGCEHSRCSKLCFELCDIKPCNKPCRNLLPCGHACIGICGEPCPPKCRICDSKIVSRWDPQGKERFVLLADCNHIIRAKGLDSKLKEKQHAVQTLICPLCGCNIFKTWRYINYNKMLFRDLVVINLKNEELMEQMKLTYEKTIKELLSVPLHFDLDRKKIMQDLSLSFPDTSSRPVEPIMVFKALFIKCLISLFTSTIGDSKVKTHCKYLLVLLKHRSENSFSSQVMKELYKELVRYHEDNNSTDKESVINVHQCIAFACLKERHMWSKCTKGHIHTSNALITKCYTCSVLV